MNIAFGLISIIICTYLGFILSDKYNKRKTFYQSFNNFNKLLISEVSFTQSTILSIINKNSKTKDVFYQIINDFYFDKQNLSLLAKLKYLSNEEKDFIKEYLNTIGINDKSSQLKFLSQADDNLKKTEQNCIENQKKYKVLYMKMGFLVGLIIFILLM